MRAELEDGADLKYLMSSWVARPAQEVSLHLTCLARKGLVNTAGRPGCSLTQNSAYLSQLSFKKKKKKSLWNFCYNFKRLACKLELMVEKDILEIVDFCLGKNYGHLHHSPNQQGTRSCYTDSRLTHLKACFHFWLLKLKSVKISFKIISFNIDLLQIFFSFLL